MSETDKKDRTIVEEIEVGGSQLIDKVKHLIAEGRVRKLRIRTEDDFSLELPVNVGLLAGGVVALGAPWLAAIGVIAALVARVKIEVEREPEAAPAETPAAEAAATGENA
ncbi:DUF4342 domain-containing protein [Frigidibacter oleivorans]|uniref:DUF4342 domain-containing protein n=1 Tax=Frigidibacter oleivorans TaxID=2487129 RepID=UPI000F8F3FD2|nr:DUF4342 domain-containing protein [Frigidibacter oleivorans]